MRHQADDDVAAQSVSTRSVITKSFGLCHYGCLEANLTPIDAARRVFGFKEIYSPFVRNSELTGDIFKQGVQSIRALFPRAKFIFHWRRNFTRIASSDFWQQEEHREKSTAHFASVVRRFQAYPARHPDHAFATIIEDITNRSNTTQLEQLFQFLGILTHWSPPCWRMHVRVLLEM